jgi:uncharacterized protein YutE (UPF0331/DUF86 family)
MDKKPWISGPGEILNHALTLLKNDSDVNRRLAMISIDNSIELMIKTFLGLPKRVTNLNITRKEFEEASESFPRLLDTLEKFASDRLEGIDLGEIEWYHRLRNQLYHQGNGLTVEKNKVQVYAELAKILFKNLFAVNLEFNLSDSKEMSVLENFMELWIKIERLIREIFIKNNNIEKEKSKFITPTQSILRNLEKNSILDSETVADLIDVSQARNGIVHGIQDYKTVTDKDMIDKMKKVVKTLEGKL